MDNRLDTCYQLHDLNTWMRRFLLLCNNENSAHDITSYNLYLLVLLLHWGYKQRSDIWKQHDKQEANDLLAHLSRKKYPLALFTREYQRKKPCYQGETAEERRELICFVIQCCFDQAKKKDAQSQFILGLFFHYGFFEITTSLTLAIRWYYRIAKNTENSLGLRKLASNQQAKLPIQTIGRWDWKEKEDTYIYHAYTQEEKQCRYQQAIYSQSQKTQLDALLFLNSEFGYNYHRRQTNATYLELFIDDVHQTPTQKAQALQHIALKLPSWGLCWADILPYYASLDVASEQARLIFRDRHICKDSLAFNLLQKMTVFIKGYRVWLHIHALLSSYFYCQGKKGVWKSIPINLSQRKLAKNKIYIMALCKAYTMLAEKMDVVTLQEEINPIKPKASQDALEALFRELNDLLAETVYAYLVQKAHNLLNRQQLFKDCLKQSQSTPEVYAMLKQLTQSLISVKLLPPYVLESESTHQLVLKEKRRFEATQPIELDKTPFFTEEGTNYALSIDIDRLYEAQKQSCGTQIICHYYEKVTYSQVLNYGHLMYHEGKIQLTLNARKPCNISVVGKEKAKSLRIISTSDINIVKCDEHFTQGVAICTAGRLTVSKGVGLSADWIFCQSEKLDVYGSLEAVRISLKTRCILLDKAGKLKALRPEASLSRLPSAYPVGLSLHIGQSATLLGQLYSDHGLQLKRTGKNTFHLLSAASAHWTAEKDILLDLQQPKKPPKASKQGKQTCSALQTLSDDTVAIQSQMISYNGQLVISTCHDLLLEKGSYLQAARGLHLKSKNGNIQIYGKILGGVLLVNNEPTSGQEALDAIKPAGVPMTFTCYVFTLYNSAIIQNLGAYKKAFSKKKSHKFTTIKGGSITFNTNRAWISGQIYAPQGTVSVGANHMIFIGINAFNWASFKREAKQIVTLKSVIRGRYVRMAAPIYINVSRRITAIGGNVSITAFVQVSLLAIHDGAVCKQGFLILGFDIDFPISLFEGLLNGFMKWDWSLLKEAVFSATSVFCLANGISKIVRKFLPPVYGTALDSVLAGSSLLLGIYSLVRQVNSLHQLYYQGTLQLHHVIMAVGSSLSLINVASSLAHINDFQAVDEQKLSIVPSDVMNACAGIIPYTSRSLSVLDISSGLRVSVTVVNQSLWHQYHFCSLSASFRNSQFSLLGDAVTEHDMQAVDSFSMTGKQTHYQSNHLALGHQAVISGKNDNTFKSNNAHLHTGSQVVLQSKTDIQMDEAVTFSEAEKASLMLDAPNIDLNGAEITIENVSYNTVGWEMGTIHQVVYGEGQFAQVHAYRLSISTDQSFSFDRNWSGTEFLDLISKKNITVNQNVHIAGKDHVALQAAEDLNNKGYIDGDKGVYLKGKNVIQKGWYTYKTHAIKKQHFLRKETKTWVEAIEDSGEIRSQSGNVYIEAENAQLKGSAVHAQQGEIYVKADHSDVGALIGHTSSCERHKTVGIFGHSEKHQDDVGTNTLLDAKIIEFDGDTHFSGVDRHAETFITHGNFTETAPILNHSTTRHNYSIDALSIAVPLVLGGLSVASMGLGGVAASLLSDLALSAAGTSIASADFNFKHYDNTHQTPQTSELSINNWQSSSNINWDDHVSLDGLNQLSLTPEAQFHPFHQPLESSQAVSGHTFGLYPHHDRNEIELKVDDYKEFTGFLDGQVVSSQCADHHLQGDFNVEPSLFTPSSAPFPPSLPESMTYSQELWQADPLHDIVSHPAPSFNPTFSNRDILNALAPSAFFEPPSPTVPEMTMVDFSYTPHPLLLNYNDAVSGAFHVDNLYKNRDNLLTVAFEQTIYDKPSTSKRISLVDTEPMSTWDKVLAISAGINRSALAVDESLIRAATAIITHPVDTVIGLGKGAWNVTKTVARYANALVQEQAYREMCNQHPEYINAAYQAEHEKRSRLLWKPVQAIASHFKGAVENWKQGNYEKVGEILGKDAGLVLGVVYAEAGASALGYGAVAAGSSSLEVEAGLAGKFATRSSMFSTGDSVLEYETLKSAGVDYQGGALPGLKDKLIDYLSEPNLLSKSREELIKDIESIGLSYIYGSDDGRFCMFIDEKNRIRAEIHEAHFKRNGFKFDHLHIFDGTVRIVDKKKPFTKGNSLNRYLRKVPRKRPEAHMTIKPIGDSKITLTPMKVKPK